MSRPGAATPKKLRLAERRRIVAEMYKSGKTQVEMAEELGVNQATVSRDIKTLVQSWWQSTLYDIDLAKKIELDKINNLENEYWKAWVRSCKDIITKTESSSERADLHDTTVKAMTTSGEPRFLDGVQKCIAQRIKLLGLEEAESQVDAGTNKAFELPIGVIAPSFMDIYDDIVAGNHTEYVLSGGRGSTKSTFVSLILIMLMKNNPDFHILAMRQVKDTLRDSVYAQLVWAISELGLDDEFKCTTHPMEITLIATGQKIYFRGANDPGKIKSIKTPFGYIGAVWFEELDQFHGEEAIRKIEQSVLRGSDKAYNFKSFNPPITQTNWANKYIRIPKENQYLHKSTYLDLGARVRWLGKVFLDEAEHLKKVNERAYRHEYLGEVTGLGGMVFENLELRPITDEEIAQFDRVTDGLDWGYYPDPAEWGKQHYDAARMILYVFDELRVWKTSNRALYEKLVDEKGVTAENDIIADSAEPKSIADMRSYGLTVRAAEKGPESVRYSMKWLQSLNAIVIDPERCPYAATEFAEYEYERTKDGEIIEGYPDKNNHAIDRVRYGTNRIWRVRGQ